MSLIFRYWTQIIQKHISLSQSNILRYMGTQIILQCPCILDIGHILYQTHLLISK